jgi:hypothetical protein
MPGGHYASGNWRVKAGSEEEFIARRLRHRAPSAGSRRPSHFLSFSDWADAGSRDRWKAGPEFAKGMASCRELCDDFQGADYSQVVSV